MPVRTYSALLFLKRIRFSATLNFSMSMLLISNDQLVSSFLRKLGAEWPLNMSREHHLGKKTYPLMTTTT